MYVASLPRHMIQIAFLVEMGGKGSSLRRQNANRKFLRKLRQRSSKHGFQQARFSGIFGLTMGHFPVAVWGSRCSLGTAFWTIPERFQALEKWWCPEEDSNLHDLAIAST
jgi:hypothetical protein